MSGFRHLGMGRLWYRLWHQPRARWLEIQKHGGWRRYRAMQAGQVRLSEAANLLSTATADLLPASSATVNVLTGARYWDQTAACLWTLNQHSQRAFKLRILDDGSLSRTQAELLRRLSPATEIQLEATARDRLQQYLPQQNFPTLHRLWTDYKHIRKMIDCHLGRDGFNVVLDSDMLFFARPRALLDYLHAPAGALAMTDCAESYGYARNVLSELCGHEVPSPVNVGVLGLPSASMDWAEIEHWASTLIARFGQHYFLEQALAAMLLARLDHRLHPRMTIA